MTVPKIPSFFKFEPKKFIQQIVDGMELKNGAMTIEVFINEDGNIMPSELGWRLPGCQATTNHSFSYGIDIYNILYYPNCLCLKRKKEKFLNLMKEKYNSKRLRNFPTEVEKIC